MLGAFIGGAIAGGFVGAFGHRTYVRYWWKIERMARRKASGGRY